MNNRLLGILGMIGAPFLLIDTLNNGLSVYVRSSISGVFNLVYITAWLCAVIALRRLGAFGYKGFGKVLFFVQVTFLSLANCWNLYETVQPGAGTVLYYALDACWPLSNLCMFVSGLTIAVKGNIAGWKRYVPFAVGCWLPLALINWAIFSRTPAVIVFTNIHSAVAWFLMGLSVVLLSKPGTAKDRVRPARHDAGRYVLSTRNPLVVLLLTGAGLAVAGFSNKGQNAPGATPVEEISKPFAGEHYLVFKRTAF